MSTPEWKAAFVNPERSRLASVERRLSAEREARKSVFLVGADVDVSAENGISRTAPAQYLNRLTIRAGDRIVLIFVRDIVWVQSYGNLLRLHLHNASYEYRMTMKEIHQQLDPDLFVRVHRNAIVNLDQVVDFELPKCGNAVVHLRNGKTLPISGNTRVTLRRRLLSKPSNPI